MPGYPPFSACPMSCGGSGRRARSHNIKRTRQGYLNRSAFLAPDRGPIQGSVKRKPLTSKRGQPAPSIGKQRSVLSEA